MNFVSGCFRVQSDVDTTVGLCPKTLRHVRTVGRVSHCRVPPRCCSEEPVMVGKKFTLGTNRGIRTIKAEEWDELVGDNESPFLEHEWLRCMEVSACASIHSGWDPCHLTIRNSNGKLIGAAPLYVKTHSMGEFVFDQIWADAAHRSGMRYYPKLLCGVPFTPATGRRLLTHPSEDREEILHVLAQSLRQVVDNSPEISSIHVNFCNHDEVDALHEVGFLHRKGVQYQFKNDEGNGQPLYQNFDDYLKSMKSKRRIKVKRERRSVYEDAGIEMQAYFGDEIPDDMFPTMFRIYQSTIQKFYFGVQHINEVFFDMLKQKFKKNLCFIVAKRDGEIIAGTFNVVKAGRFYGRYWGTFDDEVRNLHFESCYYKPIELCLEMGLKRMEPGAGGDEFKFLRGFDATVTNSMHYCRNRVLHNAIKQFLESETSNVDVAVDAMNQRSVLQPDKLRIDDGQLQGNNDNL